MVLASFPEPFRFSILPLDICFLRMAYSPIKHLLAPAALLAVVLGLQSSVAFLGFDLHHDALMFDAAFRLFNGEVPYRDFFYQYNLGTVLLHSGAIALLGPYVASLKLVTVLAYSSISVLVYLCAARYVGVAPSLFVALVWSLLSPFYMPNLTGYHAWPSVYMMASIMLGAYLLILSLSQSSSLLALSGGFFFGCSFWFKQTAAIAIVATVILLLSAAVLPQTGLAKLKKRQSLLGCFLMGSVLCCLPFVAYLWYERIWSDWWLSAFVFNGTWALEHRSGSSIGRLLDAFLHAHREHGYLSLVWAIVPMYLLVSVALGALGGSLLSWLRSPAKLGWSLLAVLGFSGWLMYFPVPHSFHTQMFSAPVFSLIAIGFGSIKAANTTSSGIPAPRQQLRVAFLCLTLVLLVHEVVRHVDGLARKLQQPWQTIASGSIADGLFLLPEQLRSFDRFHQAIRDVSDAHPGMPQIPLSADPLRALFPYVRSDPALFKMGVDWSWPNEIVEPGFSSRLRENLKQRKMAIYSDGLLAIPGYAPASLLDIRTPAKSPHFLYARSLDLELSRGTVVSTDWIGPVQIEELARGSDPLGRIPAFAVIPIPSAITLRLGAVEHVHVAALNDQSIPRDLSDLEFGWLMLRASEADWQTVPSLYEKKLNRHQLKPNLSPDEALLLGRFFLRHGRLARTSYFSSFYDSPKRRPYLVSREAGDAKRTSILWGNGLAVPDTIPDSTLSGAIAVPSNYLEPDPPITFYWLVAYGDKTTVSGFVRYTSSPKIRE